MRRQKREKNEESNKEASDFPVLATQMATTKLVHFLISNTRAQKGFENGENLKL